MLLRSLAPLLAALRIFSTSRTQHRKTPHRTAVASGALSEDDDGEMVGVAAHSPIEGVTRDSGGGRGGGGGGGVGGRRKGRTVCVPLLPHVGQIYYYY